MSGKSRTHDTYERLKISLLNGEYRPAERLKIDRLCQDLNVSPGAVREALSRLTSEGLVSAEPQRGFVVAPTSREELIDLTDVRIEIEAKCLRNSIEHGDLAWEGNIKNLWHQLSHTPVFVDGDRSHPSPEWSHLHSAFHEALTSACQSQWWLRLRKLMFIQAERYRRLILPYSTNERDADAEHEALVEAALARDADRACELIAQHLNTTLEVLLRSNAPIFQDLEAEGEEKELA